jgi:hypothetical protein
MGQWGRWLDKREARRKGKQVRIALEELRPQAQEAWDKLYRALSDEIDRRLAVGELTSLMWADVFAEATTKLRRSRLNPYKTDQLDPVLLPAAIRELVTDAIDACHKHAERVRTRKHKVELSLREANDDAARRKPAAAAAPDLLARAGVSVGRNELKIATLLLMRHEHVTTEQMQQSVRAFKDAYERRVQRYKDTGGKTEWPTADLVIQLLFGRPDP